MGLTDQLLAIKGELPRSQHDLVSASDVAVGRKWSVFRPRKRLGLAELDMSLERLSTAGQTHALAIYLQSSDFAYLAGATPDGIGWRVVLGGDRAEDYREGLEALELVEKDSRGAHSPVAVRVAEWCRSATRPVDEAEIRSVLGQTADDWILAEEGISDFLQPMGLRFASAPPKEFRDAIQVRDIGSNVEAEWVIDNTKVRYVYGWGEGFVGIWDRESPSSGPIEQLPTSPEGQLELRRRWLELVAPGPGVQRRRRRRRFWRG